MSVAKTDELIEVPFEIWTQVVQRNRVLGLGPDCPWEGVLLRVMLGHARLALDQYSQLCSLEDSSDMACGYLYCSTLLLVYVLAANLTLLLPAYNHHPE